jgi:hypothetical protein
MGFEEVGRRELNRAVGIAAAPVAGCATVLLLGGGDKGAHVQTTKLQADKKGIVESPATAQQKF